ncbi:MAG: restriction endonuclease subunit S [Bifidobacteriaceae bacterium]|jgi:type I restriction enzyme S subunit|nr:restriction endonuclease subunit S [Bifidobacteriaceae bacterium]
MSDWAEVELGDLIDIFDSRRIPLSSRERASRRGPYPYYGAQGVIDQIDDYLFDGRYILIPEDGENLRSRKLPIAFFADGRFWVNNHAHIIKGKPGLAVDRFIQSAVEAADIGGWVTGAAQPKLSQANLKRIRVSVPPLAEQQTIGEILDAFDDLIENNRRRVVLLEEMARELYREWFVRFRFPGHESTTFVDSDLGPIPEGWILTTCGEALSFIGGSTPSKARPEFWDAGTIPWFTPTDLTKGNTRYVGESAIPITGAGMSGSSARLFPAQSVLMTSRATLGVLAICTKPATTNQGFITFLPNDRWSPTFIFEWLHHNSEELAALGTGATFKEITKGALKRFPFLIPSQDALDSFRQAVEGIEESIRVQEATVRDLAQIRNLLLPRLVTGQIDVSDLDLEGVRA